MTPEDVYYGVKLAYVDLNKAAVDVVKGVAGKVKGMASKAKSGSGGGGGKYDKVEIETTYKTEYHHTEKYEKYPKTGA